MNTAIAPVPFVSKIAKILDGNGREVSQGAVVAKYYKMEGETTTQIMGAMRGLTPANKEELAIGAAKELQYQIVPIA